MDEKKRMQVIAENITYYRKQRGITQKELAKEVGITPSTMTDYMKLRSAPSFGVIQKLADFFGIKKSDIDTTFKEEKSTIPSSSIPLPNFDPRQAILLSNYSKLDDTRKNKLLATSETLLAEEQGKVKLLTYQKNVQNTTLESVLVYLYLVKSQQAQATGRRMTMTLW